jgi:hypothetical protein
MTEAETTAWRNIHRIESKAGEPTTRFMCPEAKKWALRVQAGDRKFYAAPMATRPTWSLVTEAMGVTDT